MFFALDPLPPANLLAARDQMAVNLGFHIVLAALTIGPSLALLFILDGRSRLEAHH